MNNKYKIFIENLNNNEYYTSSNIFEELISLLEYKDSINFKINNGSGDLYDATYSISLDGKNYTVLGIKKLNFIDEREIVKNHLKYWNKNDIPFSIIILPNEIRIYNNFAIDESKMLFSSKKNNNIDLLELLSNENIISGLVLEKLNLYINKKNRVDTRLLSNLRETIRRLYNKCHMPLKNAYDFLAQCIFIKYLEDRGMIGESAFLPYKASNFVMLLKNNDTEKIKKFFRYMKKRFNGDLFDISDKSPFPNKNEINVVYDFFLGDDIYIDGNCQITMFYYDFAIIPIELISNIYETFFDLGDEILKTNTANTNGAYYTPYFLADFMIDKCFNQVEMLDGKNLIKVLDPACGSGIFLVEAFKKMVNYYIGEHGTIDGNTLTDILTNNIFGVDINEESLKITCFSLYIALLEYLKPKDIMENRFKFPNLIGINLHRCSFFDSELNEINIKADLIIGNPPWVSKNEGDHIDYCKKRSIPISDGQLAQAFLCRVEDFCNKNTIITLIVPNSIFINHNAKEYRRFFYENYELLEIFNLNRLKNMLFINASAPCSIVCYKILRMNKNNYNFNYYSFKPNLFSKLFNKIVYDKAEIIKINRNIVEKYDYIWRVLTYGDEFDFRVIKKLYMNNCTLGELINSKESKLMCERGYVVGNKKYERKEFLKFRGGNLKNAFGKYIIDYKNLPKITQEYYERPRKTEMYKYKNKILIKRTFNRKNWGAAYCENPILFTDDFHCIADKSGNNKLIIRYLEAVINSKLFHYYYIHTTKIMSSIKPELSKVDLCNFPIVDVKGNKEQIIKICDKTIKIEKLLGEIQTMAIEDIQKQEKAMIIEDIQKDIDNMIYDLYKLNDIDKETIKYTFNDIEPEIYKKTLKKEIATTKDYKIYSKYICDYFNRLLKGQDINVVASKNYSKQLYTIVFFRISNCINDNSDDCLTEKILEKIPDLLGIMSLENLNTEVIVKNNISGFLQEGFFVIKTKEYKNWTKMSAIKDANYFVDCIFNSFEGAENL
ncbi:MAG: N-6 DNA methylase [Clostridium sp.]|jgi:hypothetical protein|uniref:Eco57I restriction-modification methylase domain-containing protein n=1 Tax=Clostridium sp. TaxID=1506 RepID=UPI0025BC6FD5|nr:N-6 DNA methylase [Clostridium sp.]MCH3965731.1 N-6 DNA methylase [Clostridium sp.]